MFYRAGLSLDLQCGLLVVFALCAQVCLSSVEHCDQYAVAELVFRLRNSLPKYTSRILESCDEK